jgi:DNA-binding response OmpR family regulator
MSRVLVVEDNPSILRGIADNLRFEGYEVDVAGDGLAGYKLLRDGAHDLVILDVMLPGMGGYEICQKARDGGVLTPIIMLTARGEETDRVLGLDLGADDYITKPFSVRELLARVRAVLRRARPAGELDALEVDGVRVDFRSFEATRDGQPVALTRKEFGVLRFLASHAGEVVRRDTLLDEVWGYDSETTTRTVDNHVASLRAKMERDPRKPVHLLTVHGVGYKWVPQSREET